MGTTRTLFGKKIVPHHLLNYAEQIYDILVSEIELGRWQLNDRLPGVIQLARELDFGTKTVQTAYDRLKREGYLQSRGYRGTYLKSMHPLPPAVHGERLGVLIAADQAEQQLILWYRHVILQVARQKGLTVEVRTRPADGPGGQVQRRGAVFGPDVMGVLSLTPFRSTVRYGDDPGLLPLVFLVPPYHEDCSPRVCADVRDAYFDLTCRLIREGHRKIVFSEDAIEPDPRQTILHREGYLEAMREHGLPVDEDHMRRARRVRNDVPADVAAYLKEWAREPRAKRPTAIVAGSLGRATVLVRLAPECRVSVPNDLSIVSIGSAHVDGERGVQISGMHPDFELMIQRCLDMLDQQRQQGCSQYTHIHMRMHFVPGQTMKRTRPAQPPTVRG